MLFDPATVARGPKRRAHDLPAGAARLTTSAVGLHGVWINGAQVTDAQGLLRRPQGAAGRGAPLLRGLTSLQPECRAPDHLPLQLVRNADLQFKHASGSD